MSTVKNGCSRSDPRIGEMPTVCLVGRRSPTRMGRTSFWSVWMEAAGDGADPREVYSVDMRVSSVPRNLADEFAPLRSDAASLSRHCPISLPSLLSAAPCPHLSPVSPAQRALVRPERLQAAAPTAPAAAAPRPHRRAPRRRQPTPAAVARARPGRRRAPATATAEEGAGGGGHGGGGAQI